MHRCNRKLWINLMVSGCLSAPILSGCGGSSAPPPINVSISPAAQNADQGQSVNIGATVTNDASGKGVVWSVNCSASSCGSFSSQTATSATYTAPGHVTASLSVKITATAAADASKSASSSVTVAVPPSITTTSLPDGTAGATYSASLQGSGGVAPLTWSLASGSSFPAGLNLNSDGSITGTPSAGGTSNFAVQLADSGNPPLTASVNLSINVTVLPLSISTSSLPNGMVDVAYKQKLQATGGIPPYNWTVVSGALPPWASLSLSAGIINGIPSTTGTASFTVQVADSEMSALTSTQTLSITTVAAASANDSELSGHYAFLFNGFDDVTGSQVAVAGSFVADGKGKITAGIEDENGPAGAALSVPFTGTYNIASDNRGAFTLTTASGAKTYALVLNSISSGIAQRARFVAFDDTSGSSGQRGSGIMRLQDPTAFSTSKLTGPYAFGFQGQDATGKREVMVGSFDADGAGTISTGIADQNVGGAATNPTLTGSYTAPSATNGRATMKLVPSSASTLDLSAYVVSANEFLVMTTNAFSSDGLASGTILSQSSASFDNSSFNAPVVYYQVGVTLSGPSLAEVGLLTPDGNGSLTSEFDTSAGGGTLPTRLPRTNYAVSAGGRLAINGLDGTTNVLVDVLYLVDKNKAFFLDASAITGLGFAEPQSPAPTGGFTNASLSGALSAATAGPSISADPDATGLATLDGSGSFTEIMNLSSSSGLFVDQTTSGTYTIGADGRGLVNNPTITTASISIWMLALFAGALFLIRRAEPQRGSRRPTFALMCFTLFIAAVPESCKPPQINKLIFYVISPTKAVMIHQAPTDHAPVVTILEE